MGSPRNLRFLFSGGRPMTYDSEKFKNLVHYICAKCSDPRQLGATKLNKIIWYSEREAFAKLGTPITGVRFVKREFGPVPPAVLPTLAELQSENTLLVRDTEYFGKPKREYISLREPDIADFTAEEISIIDRVSEIICERHTAASISDLTHGDI